MLFRSIGRLVVGAAEALGMKVVGYDPFVKPEGAAAISPDMKFTTELADVFGEADYITIHVPATASTKGMIDAGAIAQMKDGAVFLNFSRDTLVDDAAMAKALESGKISRYVTDFANSAVMAMQRAIVLPHLGASTAEAEDNCAIMAVQEIKDYLETGKKTHCVN